PGYVPGEVREPQRVSGLRWVGAWLAGSDARLIKAKIRAISRTSRTPRTDRAQKSERTSADQRHEGGTCPSCGPSPLGRPAIVTTESESQHGARLRPAHRPWLARRSRRRDAREATAALEPSAVRGPGHPWGEQAGGFRIQWLRPRRLRVHSLLRPC